MNSYTEYSQHKTLELALTKVSKKSDVRLKISVLSVLRYYDKKSSLKLSIIQQS